MTISPRLPRKPAKTLRSLYAELERFKETLRDSSYPAHKRRIVIYEMEAVARAIRRRETANEYNRDSFTKRRDPLKGVSCKR